MECLDTGVVKSKPKYPDHIIVRILEAGIDTVEAGWCKFKIHFTERILEDGDLCHGSVNFDEYTLRLDPRMNADFALETVLHELLHIVTMSVGYGDDIEGHVKNEELTTQLSRGLLQLYRLNPKLMMIVSELVCKETPLLK